MGDNDPLMLSGFSPDALEAQATSKALGKKIQKPPDPLAVAKEERLRQKEERLTQSKARASDIAAAEAVPSEPTAPEPTVDRSALIDKIMAYRERFPHIKKRNKIDGRSSIEELQDELHYIQVQLGSSASSQLPSQAFCAAMYGIEQVHKRWNPMNLRLDGLGQVARDNVDEFAPILDELAIKYGASMYLIPEYRLALSIGTLLLTVHTANSGDPRLAATLEKMGQQVAAPPGSSDL